MMSPVISEKDSTRQKILDAAIRCIGEYGIQSVTTRMIAESAQVNNALINYHFGSKKKLMSDAMRCSLDNFFSEFLDESAGAEKSGERSAVLERFLAGSLRDAIAFPRITKSFLYNSIVHDNCDSPFSERLNAFLNRLHDRVGGRVGEKSNEEKLALLQIVSSVLFVALVPDFFNGFLSLDLRNPAIQKRFVASLLRHYGTPRTRSRNSVRRKPKIS